MRRITCSVAFGLLLVTSVACGLSPKNVSGVTNTQAILSYTAPDEKPCKVEIREAGSTELVNDVNPALFPGADLDSRPGSLSKGRTRLFVAGRRAAEVAADGKYRSRALQAYQKHSFRARCGSTTVAEGEFETANIPLGVSYSDPHPVDPKRPGQYAWPSMYDTGRDRTVIDPQTGMRLGKISAPQDGPLVVGGEFRSVSDNVRGWMGQENAIRDDDAPAIFSGSGNPWLFLEMENKVYRGGAHGMPVNSLSIVHISLNAWQPASSESRQADERALEICLTANGVSCTSAILEAPLKVCKSGCTDRKYRFAVGDPPPPMSGQPLANWSRGFPTPPITINDLLTYSGTVNRNGKVVQHAGGNRFNLKWTKGTVIEIGSTPYLIERVDHDEQITLQAAPFGEEKGQVYKSHAAGVLIRRKSPERGTIMIQSARWDMEQSRVADFWDAGGDGEVFNNCAPRLSPGPDGEEGWHCQVGGFLYWIGKDSGRVNQIGSTFLPERRGPDGWGDLGYCMGGFWDSTDPNVFYCALVGRRPWMIAKATYRGKNEPSTLSPNGAMLDCDSQSEPCWQAESITPPSKKRGLYDLALAFQPELKELRAVRAYLVSPIELNSDDIGMIFVRGEGSNDSIGYGLVFNVKKRQFVAAASSYKQWPMRWGSIHGSQTMAERGWVGMPVSTMRGPYQGEDFQGGQGPYISRITSGPVSTKGEPCPSRPADSPIDGADWPKGDVCLTVTVDGEPGDPTPRKISQGTITVDGTSITGKGTEFDPGYDGAQILIGGQLFRFTYVSQTNGRLDKAPPFTVRDSPYVLYLDEVNNPRTANPGFGYLQDAEVRDLFCAETSSPGGCYRLYTQVEYLRLIVKKGNTWTLERGYRKRGGRVPFLPQGPNAYLSVLPTSCVLSEIYPCPTANVFWNYAKDPQGANANGKTIVTDPYSSGGGHSFARPAGTASSVSDECPKIDDTAYGCYNVRLGPLEKRIVTPEAFQVTLNPTFAGKKGVGEPNHVDGHPSYSQYLAAPAEREWFIDGRPFLGASVTGSANAPGLRIEGDLYRFRAAQLPRLRPRVLPTVAFCGVNPLLDISGPDSRIAADSEHSYRYCIAGRNGECRPDSTAGDAFVNCPQINKPYCFYPGIATFAAEIRDICLFDNGAHTQSITQVGFSKPDLEGKNSRVLTQGLSRYRYNDVFWNARTTPDGKWLMFRTPWVDGQRWESLIGKIPPFPASNPEFPRNTFVPVPVEVKAQAGAASAVVEFGYTPEFHCTSRREPCVKGSARDFAFASENPVGVACPSGCRISVPGISHRILYYRVHQRNSAGKTIKVEDVQVVAVP